MMNLMKKTRVAGGIALFFAASLGAATLCENGRSDYAIRAGTNVQERIAAEELQEIFEKSTGVKLPIVASEVCGARVQPESIEKSKNRKIEKWIYVGYTPEAEVVFGKDDLGEHAFAVTEKKVEKGGRGREEDVESVWMRGRDWNGTLLAVYAFCEDALGYRHFMPFPDGERIVRHDAVRTEALAIRRTVRFPLGRELKMTYLYPQEVVAFSTRNGGFLPARRYNRVERYKGLRPAFDGKDSGHGFFLYMPCKRCYMDTYPWDERIDFFARHPDWYSMAANGKRTDRMQLCFSNPELRKAFTKRVLERCRRVGGTGVLTVGAQDVPGAFCWCKPCRELQAKYGSPGGAYYDYLPELCAAVAQAYPKIRISTLAYRKEQTENFPKGIEKFPDNFICDFAPVDDNQSFNIGGKGNEKTLENLKKWCKACKSVSYWYYACTSGQPYGPVSRVAGDLRAIDAAGTAHAGLCGMYSPGLCNMLDYLFLRLTMDPSQDPWPLVKEYCDFAYGAAGATALSIIRDLDALWFKPNPFVGIDVGPSSMTVYKAADIVRWQKQLEAVAPKIAGDARAERMLAWLRWDIDFLTLTFWKDVADEMKAKGEDERWLTPDAIWSRMKATALFQPHARLDKPPKSDKDVKGKWAAAHSLYLMTKAVGKPLPAPLDALPKEVVVHTIPQCGGFFGMSDPDALCGAAKTECIATNTSYYVYTKRKIGFDYYDENRKRMIRHGEIDISKATPGKYELYSLGKVKVVPGALITFLTWWGIGQNLTNYYPEGDADREFELWASVKLVGPHYGIPTEDNRNRLYCDAFYLVDRNGRKYKGERKE